MNIWISNALTVDMHVECIDADERIDYLIIFIKPTHKRTKVSFATLLRVETLPQVWNAE